MWLNGEPLAQIDAGSPEVLTYLHTDHLATPRAGSNAAGSTVWTWDSGAFGKEAATGSATVNLRFPGQYFDSETGLHYNWNRYYNPAMFGPAIGEWEHHPRAPSLKNRAGYNIRNHKYWRKRSGGKCCVTLQSGGVFDVGTPMVECCVK